VQLQQAHAHQVGWRQPQRLVRQKVVDECPPTCPCRRTFARVARQVRDRYGHIDILVNKAGAAFSRREQSADGLELTWATNHLAPFLLTELLLPLLVAAPAGRIVNVASEFYGRKLDRGNLQGERKYSYFGAYRASKLGEVFFTTELARCIKGSGVAVVSVSPGPAKTNFAMPSGMLGVVLGVMQHTPMFKPAGQAANGIAWAATAPELAGKIRRALPAAVGILRILQWRAERLLPFWTAASVRGSPIAQRRHLHPLRPETKGQAGACPGRTRTIPCNLRGGDNSEATPVVHLPPPRAAQKAGRLAWREVRRGTGCAWLARELPNLVRLDGQARRHRI